MLVEDHLLTRIGLKTLIERVPEFKVIGEAENGLQAVEKVEQLNPDIVLMDVGMPIMDGIEAARKIKEKHEQVRVVMLTSHDSESDIFASLAAGAGGYCLKDTPPERLYQAVRSVQAGDVWLDAVIAAKILRQYSSAIAGHSAGPVDGEADAKRAVTHASANAALPEPLSTRELEVLRLMVDGLSNQDIADTLVISVATVKTHVRNILNKLAVDDRTQAAVLAMRTGMV
jgi:DNA-binding NarL/FixJ family response regulator